MLLDMQTGRPAAAVWCQLHPQQWKLEGVYDALGQRRPMMGCGDGGGGAAAIAAHPCRSAGILAPCLVMLGRIWQILLRQINA